MLTTHHPVEFAYTRRSSRRSFAMRTSRTSSVGVTMMPARALGAACAEAGEAWGCATKFGGMRHGSRLIKPPAMDSAAGLCSQIPLLRRHLRRLLRLATVLPWQHPDPPWGELRLWHRTLFDAVSRGAAGHPGRPRSALFLSKADWSARISTRDGHDQPCVPAPEGSGTSNMARRLLAHAPLPPRCCSSR
jgi:hypothetical protein